MKTKTTIIIFLFLSIFGACPLCAQSSSTLGTDFWVTSVSNFWPTVDVRITLKMLAPRQCTVRVVSTYYNYDSSFSVTPTRALTVGLPQGFRTHQSELIHDHVFHVTSSDSIALFAISGNGHSDDVSLILPTRLLGNEYIVQTYESLLNGSSFQVVAIQDNTEVTIIPSARTMSGRQAGVPFTMTIPNAGQSLQIESFAGMNLTGSSVKTTDGRPVAVFQGTSDARVYDENIPVESYRNRLAYMYEQSVPVNFWGKEFVVPHTSRGLPDYVIVLSSADNCRVYRDGHLDTTLNARQMYKYRVDNDTTADYIVTSKPANVSLIPFIDPNDTGSIGQSCMITVFPLQWKTKQSFFCIGDEIAPGDTMLSHSDCLLHVVAKSSDINSLRFQGEPIASHFRPVPHEPHFSHANLSVDINFYYAYNLECENCDGFVGYLIRTDMWVEGFSIGAAIQTVWNNLIVGDVQNADTNDLIFLCAGDTLQMRVKSRFIKDSVRWLFGDGFTATGDTVRHAWSSSGLYTLTAIAYSSCDTCYLSIDTLQTRILVHGIDTTSSDTLVCGDSWVFGDSTYTEGQSFSRTFHNRFGCDSIKIITVHPFGSVSAITDTLSACDSVQFLGHTYRQQALVAYDTVPNYLGCDSILIRAININPSYYIVEEVSIYDTISYTWIDGRTYSESTESPYIVLPARNGCDSIIHLHLLVEHLPEPPDSSAIWVPNAFTPDESANKFFRVFCNDIISAQVSIFTRQGLHVVTFDGLTDAWDGTYNGIPCTQGAYVYMINYTRKSKPKYIEHKTGTVLLIR